MKKLVFSMFVVVIVTMCLLIPGVLFFSQAQSSAPPPPPPDAVWCCRNGQVSYTSAADCFSTWGTSYSTQAEAIAHCEQAPPVAVWCCRNGQVSITSGPECSSLGGTSYSTTQEEAIAACLSASSGNTGNTGGINIGGMYIPITLPTPTTYKFTVNIGTGLKEGKTEVLINGKKQADLAGGESREFEADLGASPVVSVKSPITGQQGNRFTVKGDAEKKVSEGDSSAYFDFAPAVYIEFVTDPPNLTALSGTDWYSVGDKVQSSAPAYVDAGDPNTRYTFLNWTLPNGQKSQMKSLSLTASAAATATASYVTYYRLNVSSPYGPDDTTWQKAGEEANWQVKNPQAPMDGIMGMLGGQMKAVNASGQIMMDGPKNVTVQYQPSYPWLVLLLIAAVIIGGGIFAFVRLRAARAGSTPATVIAQAPVAAATTDVKAATTATVPPLKEEAVSKPAPESEAKAADVKPRAAPKFCPECGNPVEKDEKFCSNCGRKFI